MKRILVLILFINPNLVFSQTTDQIKYYIAYDGSGSVAISDNNHRNLFNLFQRFNLFHDSVYKSNVSFDLFIFGEEVQTNNFNIDDNSNAVRKISNQISHRVKYNAKVKKTQIDLALDQIIERIKSQDINVSRGLFIFTDGLLRPGDIKSGENIDDYRRRVTQKLELIKFYKVPIFIIETSRNPANSFFDVQSANATQSYYNGGSFFWTSVDQSIRSDSSALTAFDRFVNGANQTIIYNSYERRDEISTAIKAAQAINILKLFENTDARFTNSSGNVSYNSLNRLGGLIDADNTTMSGYDMGQIQSLLHDLEIHSSQLGQLEKEVSQVYANYLHSAYKASTLQDINTRVENTRVAKENNLLSIVENVSAEPTSVESVKKYDGKNFEEAMILGLTDYIIERTKFEAAYAFMEQMSRFMDSTEESRLLKEVFFPNTYDVLNNPARYNDVARIKILFQKDLDRLPENIVRYSNRVVKSEGLVGLIAFYQLYNDLLKTASIEASFKNLAGQFENVHIGIQNSKVQKSILFTSKLIGYLSTNDLTLIFDKPDQMRRFSKLVLALVVDTSNIDMLYIDKAVASIKDVYSQYRILSGQITNLNKLLKDGPQGDIDGFRTYQRDLLQDILSKTSALLMSGNDILDAIEYQHNDIDPVQTRFIVNNASKCIDAYLLLKNRDYVNAGILLSTELSTFVRDSIARDKFQTLIEITSEVSSAKSATEVKNTITKYALPVASYRIKRTEPYSIMLTAYPGFGVYAYSNGQQKLQPGIMVPIGIEFSRSISSKNSLSLMLTIIDIGNIVDYRLTSNESDTEIINFQRIVSPGGLLSWGPFAKVPIVVVGGYMFNPNRFMLGATVDLPIFSFWRYKKGIPKKSNIKL